MEDNGSLNPTFETDDQTYVLVTLPVHNVFKERKAASDQASDQVKTILDNEVHNRVAEMLKILNIKTKRADLFKKMDLSNHTTNRKKYLDPLIDLKWVEMEFPEERTNPNQTYKATDLGNNILKLIS